MSELDNLPSNSNVSKQLAKAQETPEQQDIHATPVASGSIVQKKPSILDRLIKTFIKVGPRETLRQLTDNVLVPSTINLISDAIVNAKDIMLYGSTTNSVTSSDDPLKYNKQSQQQQQSTTMTTTQAAVQGFSNVDFATREEAERVKNALLQQLTDYEAVTVAYFYEAAGCGGNVDHPDFSWGWKNLKGIGIRQIPPKGRWIVVLPPCKYIGR